MKRLLPVALGITLFWSYAPDCSPANQRVYDAYIESYEYGQIEIREGYRFLPGNQRTVSIGGGNKPVPLCAIAFRFPEALDAAGELLPEPCQPVDLSTDSGTWPGM